MFCETNTVWNRQAVDFVQNGFICFAYTMRGFGESDGECALYSGPEIEDVYVAVQEALRCDPNVYHGSLLRRWHCFARLFPTPEPVRVCRVVFSNVVSPYTHSTQ